MATKSNCPLESGCERLKCSAVDLLEWQSKHSLNSYKLGQLVNKIAQIRCRR